MYIVTHNRKILLHHAHSVPFKTFYRRINTYITGYKNIDRRIHSSQIPKSNSGERINQSINQSIPIKTVLSKKSLYPFTTTDNPQSKTEDH